MVRPIDPLAPLQHGRYVDDLVTVVRDPVTPPAHGSRVAVTAHFELWRDGSRLVVRHHVPDGRIDDSLTSLIDAELFAPGWASGSDLFERIFTGIVLTARPDPLDAWILFYDHTFRRMREHRRRHRDRPAAGTGDAVEEFAVIHATADGLVPPDASVLEIGACFGFLALHLARLPRRRVEACDLTPGTMRLLGVLADRLGVPVRTFVADAARVPRPDRSADVVLLVHLLEHLDAAHGRRAIEEALRVARHRVVIAVPYEQTPNAAFGHVRCIDRSDLDAWGAAAQGWSARTFDALGGWLVLDRLL
ncbi:methyltransferase domain-containing protein [Nakamurella sp. YIM 132087]|uniref:Methyltransferase domain-containing protein n=1 Tax=Nakamurella alba TaxID=2665158 RepID=A0A7K1FMY7_9ACTN|nr:methyltransferase domain-containing protein [Nakamurella alba]